MSPDATPDATVTITLTAHATGVHVGTTVDALEVLGPSLAAALAELGSLAGTSMAHALSAAILDATDTTADILPLTHHRSAGRA